MYVKNNRFRGKSFTTFTLLLSFLIMGFSGIIQYIRPEGGLADRINWTFWGLSKKGWEGVHIVFVLFFLIMVVFHLFYNWKVLMRYFKSKASEGFRMKKEFALAALLSGFVLIASIEQWQPFWKLMEWREVIKKRTGIVTISPDIPYTEEMSLSEISKLLDIPVRETIQRIKDKGYIIDESGITLDQIAEWNNTSTEKLFSEISDK